MFFLTLPKIVFIGLVILALIGVSYIRRCLKQFNLSRQYRNQAYQARRNASRGKQDNRRQTIVDRRTPEQTNRKIIPDDQGEYVEYTEVK